MNGTIGIGSFGGLLITLALAACADPVCGCSPLGPEVSGSIHGRVFTPDSIPVANAPVTVDFGPGSCDQAHEEIELNPGHSNSNGVYFVSFVAYTPVEDPCLRVIADSPVGSGAFGSDTVYIEVTEAQFEIDESVDLYLR